MSRGPVTIQRFAMNRTRAAALASLLLWGCAEGDPPAADPPADAVDMSAPPSTSDGQTTPPDASEGMPDADLPGPRPDAGGPEPPPRPPPQPPQNSNYECQRVGGAYTDGIFTLTAYQGALYAGLFGYGHEQMSMLYRFPPWELVSPGLTGISESICAMREFDGFLYANTESSGDIHRSVDGTRWERVYDGEEGSIGCGLAALGGHLYAINYRNSQRDHGRILRQEDDGRWTTVYDSGGTALYLREIVAYEGRL